MTNHIEEKEFENKLPFSICNILFIIDVLVCENYLIFSLDLSLAMDEHHYL
jgi:hypothetical protein